MADGFVRFGVLCILFFNPESTSTAEWHIVFKFCSATGTMLRGCGFFVVVVHDLLLSSDDFSMVSFRFANQLSNKLDGAVRRLGVRVQVTRSVKVKTHAQTTTFRQKQGKVNVCAWVF